MFLMKREILQSIIISNLHNNFQIMKKDNIFMYE